MRKYTEQELRAEFETHYNPSFLHRDGGVETGQYFYGSIEKAWQAFLRCARFLGALSEAHKG